MDLRELNGGDTLKINIAGVEVEVERTAPVKETLKQLLEERGIDNFVIYLDGEEVTSSAELPETFEDVETLEVQRYVKAG
ncbi:MAG: hypothetical protein J7K20_02060 [Thermodesulfobacterium sp.]|nr:hypothetical protein [Thermodesulfobacterium sp.]